MKELFSPSWYRIATLKPRLRSHIEVQRQFVRGDSVYVVYNRLTTKFHQFTRPAYFVIGLMNGQRTVQQIWQTTLEQLGDGAPTQPKVTQLIEQLHQIDALVMNRLPHTGELAERSQTHLRQQLKQRFLNVFAWRIPLCDPNRILLRMLPFARPFLGTAGLLIWLAVVISGSLVGASHWDELSADLFDQALAPGNLLLLWLLFPVIKLAHEWGHAMAARAFGAEVHELGIMILVISPVPYVDASGAWCLKSKWQRIVISAAGMAVELFVAAWAVFLWVSVEPGLIRMMAYNTILIAGVSTLLFNANPLMRFDGYYMLMDFLEIPNLQARSVRYFGYLFERYLVGHREGTRLRTRRGEPAWFVLYGISSTVYRVAVVISILLFLGEKWPLVALLFAALTSVSLIIIPVVRMLAFLIDSPKLCGIRGRAGFVAGAICAGILAFVCLVPLPFHSTAEGVVWLPDEAFVRAGNDGFVVRVIAEADQLVHPGDPVILLANPRLSARLAVLEGRVHELKAKRREQEQTDRVKMAILEEELHYIEGQRAMIQYQVDELTIRSHRDGSFVIASPQDLPGRFVKQGELLAHVVDLSHTTVRAVVRQTDIALVQRDVIGTGVRLAEQRSISAPAEVVRLVPAAMAELPSRALGSEGGGELPIDPKDDEKQHALQKVFQVDLQIPTKLPIVNAGGRAYVRFSHPWAPLSVQAFRALRQLFIARLNV